MKHLKLFASLIVVSFLLVTGCKKEVKPDKNSVPLSTQIQSNATTKKISEVSAADLKEKFKKLVALLPASYRKGLGQKAAFVSKLDPVYRTIVRRAVGVEPTPCDPNTPVMQWLDKQLADWSNDALYYASYFDLYDVPFYYAYVFENTQVNQTFGENGEYTHTVTKTFKDLKRFWNIQTNDIIVVPMHGSILRDRNKLIKTNMIVYGMDAATATAVSDFILVLLDVFPEYRDGDHPIFTFNSFSSPEFYFPPVGVVPSKIIMGDGVMEAYTAIGYGDVAPQAILAHEYGHQVQFQLHVFTSESSPAATRRTELMADAFSAYYLSHARGASMQWKRVRQFLQVFYNIGDCGFDDDSHHGTPLQRMAAAEWAYHLADDAQKQGHILTAQRFVSLFDAELPAIVAQ
jgi:hypothetical protein